MMVEVGGRTGGRVTVRSLWECGGQSWICIMFAEMD